MSCIFTSYVGQLGSCGHWNVENDSEKLNDLYSSSDIIRMIKSRRTRWAEHVARVV